MRGLLDERDFLDVDTPVLQEVPGGGHARPLSPITTRSTATCSSDRAGAAPETTARLWLERVYEIGRCFRNEGRRLGTTRSHAARVLQAYADYDDVMRLVEDLFVVAAMAAGRPLETSYQGEAVDLTPPFGASGWRPRARAHGKHAVGEELNERSRSTSSATPQPTFVIDYPVEISPLARPREDDPRFVERFELIILAASTPTPSPS